MMISMDRNAYLQSLIDTGGAGLEIGPGYDPLLPKAMGYNVRTVDHLDAAGLRAKYRGAANVDVARIEEVDYVLGEVGFADAIGQTSAFDYIVASHVVEHTPDMLGFLQQCESLLKPDGVLVLAVPDKRYCFDVFQSLTSTGMILEAHQAGRLRPGIGSIWDERAYGAVRDGAIGWSRQSSAKQQLKFFTDLPAALATLQSSRQSLAYVDVHVWRFVPSSFRLIVNDLFEIGEIALRERSFREGDWCEFFVALSRSAPGCPVDRLALAKRMVVEQAQIAVDPSLE